MINQKIEITKYIAEKLELATDEKNIRKFLSLWWQNPRYKKKGGLRLTDEGFARLTSQITCHRVRFENQLEYTGKLVLEMDNLIECPWYIGKRDIFVFNDKMAVQLVLFSGDISKFTRAKTKSATST